jgi:hypothetical protein
MVARIMPDGSSCCLLTVTSSALFLSLPGRLERPPCEGSILAGPEWSCVLEKSGVIGRLAPAVHDVLIEYS